MKKLTTLKKSAAALALVALVLGSFGLASSAFATGNTVTIVKYVNGAAATATSANNTSFTMNATWNDTGGVGSGSGQFTLGASNTTPYQATTVAFQSGASYSTSEVMDSNTGTSCASTPFMLQGYTTGATLADAAAATPSLTAPSFTNLQSNEFVIVWNQNCATSGSVTTQAATNLSSSNATLNAMNGGTAATGSAFWVSTSPFSATSGTNPTLPANVFSSGNLGAVAANTAFSSQLSATTGLPTIQPNTTYYFTAWVLVNGTWVPGQQLSFTTSSSGSMANVTILKYINGQAATSTLANGSSFGINTNWNASNLGGAGSNNSVTLNSSSTTPFQYVSSNMALGSSFSLSEPLGSTTGSSCSGSVPFSQVGYTSGDTLAAAQAATPSTTAPSFTNLQGNKYVIVWNNSCSNFTGNNGNLQVVSINQVKNVGIADGNFNDGWKYIFTVNVPAGQPNVTMQFSNWLQNGGSGVIPAGSNMRISSPGANNNGAFVTVSNQNTFTSPALVISNVGSSGTQTTIEVDVAIPSGTPNGTYSTTYTLQTQ